ncbi:leucine-rich repeat protein, partial [Enterococcus faecium]
FKDSAGTITDFTLNNVTETPDIPNNSAAITEQGFRSFTSLSNVQMDNVVTIGERTFRATKNLSNIVAPKLEEVRVAAFYGTHLTDINNLKNLKIIGDWAFGFVPLEKIDLPNVTSVAGNAFSAHDGNTPFEATITEVNLPNATDVDMYAFNMQDKIQKVNLGITDTTQLATMFGSSAGTITDFTLNNVTEIPDLSDEETDAKGFGIFSVLKNVQMDNIVRVGANTFTKYNATLEHVSMPKVEEIGDWAFGCATGGSVILDLSGLKNVKKIGEGAFEYLNTSNPDFPNVTSVGAEAFKQYKNMGIITEINMPNATDVDNSAFSQQPKIEKVNLGITDTTKLATMFGSSAGTLTDLTLNNVTATPDLESASDEEGKGFSSFTALKNVQMDNVVKIGVSTFQDVRSLSNIVAPKLEEVGSHTFSATHLTDLSNLKNLKIIGDWAFAYNYLEKIDLPNVTSIRSNAFSSRSGSSENQHPTITEVNLPNATDVDMYAFQGQNKIQKVNLGITDTTQLGT